MYSAPSDALGRRIVDLITHPTETRDRLCAGIYTKNDPGNPLALLQAALEKTEELSPLDQKLRDAVRAGIITADGPLARIDAAQEAGVLSQKEAKQLRDLDTQVMDLIDVDDFDGSDLGTKTGRTAPAKKKTTAKKKNTAKKKKKTRKKSTRKV
jgi:acyl-CoA dehydrogenase